MAKQGMKRSDDEHGREHAPTVPEIQGKAKSGKARANPIIAGTKPPRQKVWHSEPFSKEKPISEAYSAIDTDLARDNAENDIPYADLQDL